MEPWAFVSKECNYNFKNLHKSVKTTHYLIGENIELMDYTAYIPYLAPNLLFFFLFPTVKILYHNPKHKQNCIDSSKEYINTSQL